jgi:hypothetical protein
MSRLEIQSKLYDARSAYAKALNQVEIQKRVMASLTQSWDDFDLDLYSKMFS